LLYENLKVIKCVEENHFW